MNQPSNQSRHIQIMAIMSSEIAIGSRALSYSCGPIRVVSDRGQKVHDYETTFLEQIFWVSLFAELSWPSRDTNGIKLLLVPNGLGLCFGVGGILIHH